MARRYERRLTSGRRSGVVDAKSRSKSGKGETWQKRDEKPPSILVAAANSSVRKSESTKRAGAPAQRPRTIGRPAAARRKRKAARAQRNGLAREREKIAAEEVSPPLASSTILSLDASSHARLRRRRQEADGGTGDGSEESGHSPLVTESEPEGSRSGERIGPRVFRLASTSARIGSNSSSEKVSLSSSRFADSS